MIDRQVAPLLRGTPLTPDDVYSKILYDIARQDGWLFRIWAETGGLLDNVQSALTTAAQYALRSVMRDWRRELEKCAPVGNLVLDPANADASKSPQEAWVEQHGSRERILKAISHADLTAGEACLVRSQLDAVDPDDIDSLLSRVLGRGDPAEMSGEDLRRLKDYRRHIQRRAYAKIRRYLRGYDEGWDTDG